MAAEKKPDDSGKIRKDSGTTPGGETSGPAAPKERQESDKPGTPSSADGGSANADIQKTLIEVKDLLNVQQTAAALDLSHLLSSRRRLMISNFALGLSRGIGFFIGLSLFGALLLGTIAFAFSWLDETLGLRIGEQIDKLVNIGEKFGVDQEKIHADDEERVRKMVRDYLVEEGLIEEEEAPENEGTGQEPEEEKPGLPEEDGGDG